MVTDHQGTPREIFSEGGQASWAGRLNTWGQMQFWRYREGKAENDPNYTECPFRLAGQYEDEESGLYYNRFRYYGRETGQYLSPDPIGLLGGLNPYGYVHCPTGYIDPFGLACCFLAKNPKQAHAIIQEKWGYNMSPAEMRELQKTIDNIKLNRPAYQRDGITFENNFRISPNGQRLDTGSGPYKEWTVKTPNVGNRGTRRIVVDTKTGDAFYSHDHYDSFIKIDMSGWK